ncbi:cGMP-specific 3',5'-cyclic phosphodiesterase isoform X1 [Megalobrama amblycephala]|uniref:cGMP-specific 3',5'-cyclic phosphodiesterase isoform X1 n=1 Tax=Megalobrama amblycephala TaxID=75352 RepID=UPI0020145784|nr:cGMP-specific 3',5'-cyclic phosphodiesterase isoform X1 [Megalobrama amblycephala]XP_048053318.1 cGMP-specific 3',5'-cyclic phosphodiesterase isoform X1 [Megalobrama amblycephala]XP_048053319.1 cGMP-specific 3',5'-cyclic phosphodiesterase isoform X1 [Megalobrama amblycephala]
MPCLHTESLPSLPAEGRYGVTSTRRGSQGSRSKSGKKGKNGEKGARVERNDSEKEQSVITSAGWFYSPLWTPGTKTQRLGFRMGKESERVKAWLDDHSDSARSYFNRSPRYWLNGCVERAQAVQTLITEPRSRMTSRRRVSHPMCGPSRGLVHPATMERPHSCFSLHQIDNPESLDHCEGLSPQSLQSTHFPFSPCVSRSKCLPHSLSSSSPAGQCRRGESCNFMMRLVDGLSRPLQIKNLCLQVLQHLCEITQAQRCCLSMTTVDKTGVKCLGPVFQSDEESVYGYTQAECYKCIMEYVVSTGRPLNIRDACEDPRFQIEPYEREEDRPKSILSVPILNHKKEVIGVIMAVNKSRPGSCFSEQDEKVLSSHMVLFGLILENSQLCESSEQESKRNQVLLELAQLVSHDYPSVDDMLSKMAAIILPVTKAQYCTVFISDDNSTGPFSRMVHIEDTNGSVQCSTRDCDTSDTSCMYAVDVQNSMETLNFANRPAQISKVSQIRSLIGTPLRGKQRGNVIGVCQLVNKRNMARSETEVFSRADELLLEDFAVYCALGLQKFNTQQKADKTRARLAVTKEVLSYQISASQEEINDLEESVIPSADALCLLDFGFSDFNISQAAMTQAVVRMFLDLNLPQHFNIEYKTLCQWVLSIRKCYRNNVVYHNWSHALCTAQCMFAMLQTKDLQSNFSSLEVLALMIACLSHDLDHRGVNNSYIERSNQPLAQLYGHSSLEHHHYDMCLFILNNPGSQILSSLSLKEYRACVQMIEKNILATDLAIYIEKRTKFFKLAQNNSCLWKDEGHRELLRSMLMTASDICAITKPWPVQKQIAELVATEFYAQGDRERCEFNTQPIDLMDRKNSARLPHMQVDYIDGICSPLYEALASICESCSPLKEGCRRNRKHWQQLVDCRKEEERIKMKGQNGENEEAS